MSGAFKGSAPTQSNYSIQAKLDTALALHEQGRMAEAAKIYEDILTADANHFAALHCLGIIAYQTGNLERAIDLISRAIEINPKSAFAYSNISAVLNALNRHEDALASCNKAIGLTSDFAEAHYNRGIALYGLGRLDEALASYDKTIKLKPNYAQAYSNRGVTLRNLKQFDKALASYNKAIELSPDFAEAYSNRSSVLSDLRRYEEALMNCNKAVELKPDHAPAYGNRGNCLHELRCLDEALASHKKAIELKPDYAEAYSNLGNTFHEFRRLNEALISHNKAIELRPDYAQAYVNKSMSELLIGDLDNGWRNFEWRKKIVELSGNRRFYQPCLSSLEQAQGKTILVHFEQGLGDTIQFCRYAELLHRAGARVLFSPRRQLGLVRCTNGLPSPA